MTIYCGVDFHIRQQTVCYCDTADGKIHLRKLRHEQDDTRSFYAGFADEVAGLMNRLSRMSACCDCKHMRLLRF